MRPLSEKPFKAKQSHGSFIPGHEAKHWEIQKHESSPKKQNKTGGKPDILRYIVFSRERALTIVGIAFSYAFSHVLPCLLRRISWTFQGLSETYNIQPSIIRTTCI